MTTPGAPGSTAHAASAQLVAAAALALVQQPAAAAAIATLHPAAEAGSVPASHALLAWHLLQAAIDAWQPQPTA